MNEEPKAHAPLNGDSKINLEAVEGLHDAACCASSFVSRKVFRLGFSPDFWIEVIRGKTQTILYVNTPSNNHQKAVDRIEVQTAQFDEIIRGMVELGIGSEKI